jgi:hypothetical protein
MITNQSLPPSFINTPLQQGDCRRRFAVNRFSGFRAPIKNQKFE